MTDYSANQLWLQISKHQPLIRLVVVLLLALYLLTYAAQLTWRLIPVPNNQHQPLAAVSVNPTGRPQQALDLSGLKRLNLFGELGAKPQVEQQVEDAPETRLNLTLTGVVASSILEQGAAIIANNGKQNTYGVGEKIDGTNAKLREVHADRVIIRNAGRNETLMLDGLDYQEAKREQQNNKPTVANRVGQAQRTPKPLRSQLSAAGRQASRELQRSPANFSDFISITPYSKGGHMMGYRINPGKKPTLFKEAGFKSGDVVLDINGLSVTDPSQALEAMKALREDRELQLTIDRKGQLLTLYLDIPDGEEP